MDEPPPSTSSHNFVSIPKPSLPTADSNDNQVADKTIDQTCLKLDTSMQIPISVLQNVNKDESRQTSDKANDIKPTLNHNASKVETSCEKIQCSEAAKSEHAGKDCKLKGELGNTSKEKDGLNIEDLGAPSIVSLLSPSVREVIKNVELVRLPLVEVGLRSTRSKSMNDGRRDLWPGVASCGAAVQCIHCRESGRHVLSSLLTLWQHLGILAYNHFAHCQTIPDL